MASHGQATINRYGDVLITTTGSHGADISSQRVDELDIACLDFVRRRVDLRSGTSALDIGGGHGAQSNRMAECGANVVLIDLTDQSQNVGSFNARMGRAAIRFHQADVREFDISAISQSFDIVYSQRMLSCIQYGEARTLMRRIYRASGRGAHCFISAGGICSEIGRDYKHRDISIEYRWSTISREMAEKHQMHAPECLYTEQELSELLTACGFVVMRSWTSAFGNPKVICRR